MKIRTEVSLIEDKGRTLSQRVSFYQNGQVAEKGTFGYSSNKWGWNVPMGIIEKFYDNGVTACRISYDGNGYLNGESHYFDRNGNLIKTMIHSKDKLIREMVYKKEEII